MQSIMHYVYAVLWILFIPYFGSNRHEWTLGSLDIESVVK
jgi:hypothetical protein